MFGKTVWSWLIITHLNIFLMHCFINTDIVKAFFAHHSLSHGNILSCYSKKTEINMMRTLNGNKNVMFQSSKVNHSNLLDLLFTQYKRTGVVLDGDCPGSSDLIVKSGHYRFFGIKYYWLIFTTKKKYKEIFCNAHINIDSNIQVVTPENKLHVKQFNIDDFYNPASSKGGKFIITRVGYYNNLTGYSIKDGQNKFWQRRNLSGVTFNAMIVFHDPYTEPIEEYLKSDDNRDKNTYNRFHARLMSYCSDHYRFRVNKNATNLFGYLKSDGTMDGLVGELERRTVDFGLTPLFVKKDRARVISYGRVTYTLRVGDVAISSHILRPNKFIKRIFRSAFVFRNPKSRNTFELFIRPLSLKVWYNIIGFFILSILVLKWSLSYEVEKRPYSFESSWSFSLVCLVGAFCQQGMIATPTSLSGKIAILFTLLLTTIVYQFYSGSLVSSLLNTPLVLIKSIDDILEVNFRVGVEDLRFNKEYFKFTADNASLRLYKKMILGKEEHVYYKASNGLDLMKKGQFAFHVELVKAYPFIKHNFKENEACEITTVQMYKSIPLHATYVKHSPFRDILDICLHRIAESGVLQKEYKFWHAKKPDCVYSYIIRTGLREFYPVLICVGLGIFISSVILLTERLFDLFGKPN